MLKLPGNGNGCLRLHAVFYPRRGCLTDIELTDDRQAEQIDRSEHQPGQLVIADRGLARAKRLIQLTLKNIYWIVRVHLNTIKLFNLDGTRLDRHPKELLDLAQRSDRPVEQDVWLIEKGQRIQARLIVVRLPKDKALEARLKVIRRAQKKQKLADGRNWLLAGYVTVLTTLPSFMASTSAVLQWYRIRWQIELFFKRCKSLLGLQTIVSASPALQRVRVMASVLLVAIVDRMNAEVIRSDLQPTPPSVWRWSHIHVLDLQNAIAGTSSPQQRAQKSQRVDQIIRERPRKRHSTHASAKLRKLDSRSKFPLPIAA